MEIPLRSLEILAAKVARVHGAHNPKLIDLQVALGDLRDCIEEGLEPSGPLARIRTLAEGFVPPGWACTSYRTLLLNLEQLERELLRPSAA